VLSGCNQTGTRVLASRAGMAVAACSHLSSRGGVGDSVLTFAILVVCVCVQKCSLCRASEEAKDEDANDDKLELSRAEALLKAQVSFSGPAAADAPRQAVSPPQFFPRLFSSSSSVSPALAALGPLASEHMLTARTPHTHHTRSKRSSCTSRKSVHYKRRKPSRASMPGCSDLTSGFRV
jgi:hypothetical protein